MIFKLLVYSLLAITVSACTSLKVEKISPIKKAIIEQTPQRALKNLKSESYSSSDIVLYYLEKGSLLKMAGRHDESIKAFESAKIRIDELYTTSISKSIGSVLINDTVSDYEGDAFESAMLHVYQALTYLAQGELENAGVIARQLDVKLTELAEKKRNSPSSVYKCDPFANYLSGIIFERLKDWSSARITYEKAYQCYKNGIYKTSIPQQVKLSLLRAAKESGAGRLYRQYKKEFNLGNDSPLASEDEELIFVLDEGFIAPKVESSLAVTVNSQNKLRQLKISLPQIAKFNPHLVTSVRIKVKDRLFFAEKVHDLDSAKRASLEERLPAIKARTIARAIKNQSIQNNAEQSGGFLAQFGSLILTQFLEKADLRAWDSLPHTVWMSRLKLKKGTYDLNIELLDKSGAILTKRKYKKVKIGSKLNKNIYMRWATTWPYQYRKKSNVFLPLL